MNPKIVNSFNHIDFETLICPTATSHIDYLFPKVPFFHNLLLAIFSELEVLLFHFIDLIFESLNFELNIAHLIMRILQFLFHFFHLTRFLTQSLLILDQLLMNLTAYITPKLPGCLDNIFLSSKNNFSFSLINPSFASTSSVLAISLLCSVCIFSIL